MAGLLCLGRERILLGCNGNEVMICFVPFGHPRSSEAAYMWHASVRFLLGLLLNS